MALYIDHLLDFTRCILCGCATATPSPVWLDTIRVLHPTPHGRISLTGIASKYNKVATGAHKNRKIKFNDYPNCPLKPWESRHCDSIPSEEFFILHEQCWQYAEKKLYPSGKPNLKELFEVLCEVSPSRDPAYSDPSQYHPCREKTLEEFLQGDREFPEPSSSMKEKTSSSSNPTDPFRRLPLEIREKVALLLPSHEFLDLRRVSRAMSAVFHDNFFWKSRFKRDADHGYLDYIACGVTDLDQSGIQRQNTDWRLLYHASMNIGNKLETTVKVWEVVQWIKDVLAAQNGLQESPLWFSGRALQHYHNDSCATGRRVERAKISPSLVKIGVTMVSSKTVHERDEAQAGWKVFETETDILAVEFISKEHENITLGTRNKKSKNICPRNLQKKMDAYYGQENAGGETKKSAPESPFDGNGVRILFNAKPDDFGGFRIRYFNEKISSLGVLSKNMAYSRRNEPQAFGFDANDGCAFDIGMEMEDIVEVVATFEGRLLVDLGVRGSREDYWT